tara:strand:- start:274 stop:522 length:249 start_codon:yes stop_codon:yes gene_type:complete
MSKFLRFVALAQLAQRDSLRQAIRFCYSMVMVSHLPYCKFYFSNPLGYELSNLRTSSSRRNSFGAGKLTVIAFVGMNHPRCH